MKINSVFSLLFVALLGSCDYNELTDTEKPASSSVEDVKCTDFGVNMETARFAAKFLSDKEIKDIKPIVYHDKDTVLYVVNYEDGWTLLSADMRAKAVIASSQTGTFDESGSNSGSALWINNLANQVLKLKHDNTPVSYSELNKNEDYVFWHRMYLGYIAEASDNTMDNSSSHKSTMRRRPAPIETTGSTSRLYLCKRLLKEENLGTTYQSVGNRLKTKWGQGSPWNVRLPFVPDDDGNAAYPMVGCVGVAMGQVIYYCHFNLNMPTWLYHGAKLEGVYYDKKNYDIRFTTGQYVENSPRWNQMALRANSQYPTDETNYVAELFAELDYKLSMNYGYSKSGANVSRDVINQYGLTWDEGGFNSQTVEQNLRNGLPVLITSYANEKTTGWWLWKTTKHVDGHAWVIDGMSETTSSTKCKYVWELVEVRENSTSDNGGRNNTVKPNPSREPSPYDDEYTVSKVYSSINGLYRDYETFIEFNNGLNSGIIPEQECTETHKNVKKNILMNWGWSGYGDDIEYELSATTWYVSPYTFQYNTKIYYNLRKK